MGKAKKIEIGMFFDRLTVISFIGSIKSKRFWGCKCECGKIVKACTADLNQKKIKSCGCLRRENQILSNRKPPGHSAFTVLWISYKGTAKRRGKVFELNFEEFKEFITQDCFYCGKEPSRYNHLENRTKTSMSLDGIVRATVYVNGIDRVDNDIGYIKENCVPCCTICNTMKMALSKEEFLAHIAKILDYQKPTILYKYGSGKPIP